jgi:hypothetical protein
MRARLCSISAPSSINSDKGTMEPGTGAGRAALLNHLDRPNGVRSVLKKWTKAAVLCLAMGVAAPSVASAHTYYDRHQHRYVHAYDRGRDRRQHRSNCRVGGTVLGVVGGALVGNAITGHSGAGTVIGAGVGGLAGNHIARRNCR